MKKFAIYQVLPRLFGNYNETRKHNGTIEENGCGKFNSFTNIALNAIKELGVTHIWYTGILEHATKTDYSKYGIIKDECGVIKGNAGSPYAIKDYYDVDPDLAEDISNRMKEFEQLVERTHQVGLKVVIDFIPNHTARQYHSDMKPAGVDDLGEGDNPAWAFSPLNNYYYIPNTPLHATFNTFGYSEVPAKATGNDQFTAYPSEYDWYETVKLNYGVNYAEGMQKQFEPIPNTWSKMLDILLYWAAKNIDAFRVDMAEMVPVEFWNWAISRVKTKYPEVVFIAEVYNPNEYRNYICNGKFDILYDKVGMYDTLRGIISRNKPAREITTAWQSLNGIEDQMLHFLENHDEQRIGSGFFCGDGLYAFPAMMISATLTKAPFMIYFGQEFGELGMDMEGFSGVDGKTTIFDYWSIKSISSWANNGKFDGVKLTDEQKKIRSFYKKLIEVSLTEKAITDGVKYDLQFANNGSHNYNTHGNYSYFRKFEDDVILCVANFQDRELELEIRIPTEAFQYLNIDENNLYYIKNLLNEDEKYSTQQLTSITCFKVKMPAWCGKILKLTKVN